MLELLDGLVAKELHAVAAFDECHAFGGEPFELDGFHFGAVLLDLAFALLLLVAIEFALDATHGKVEEIDGRPEQAFEIGLNPRVRERCDKGIEDIRDGAGDAITFGQWPHVGFVCAGMITVQLKLGQNMVGW
jgi:hypothetical protein